MNKIEELHFLIPETFSSIKDNFFTYYDMINQYHSYDRKIYIGNDFNCRFCGEIGRKYFKKENSHTFPEFTGNKWVFSKDECIKCNQLFSKYENELASHGHVMRTLLGTKTKKGSSTKYKNTEFQIQKKESGFVMNLFQSIDLEFLNKTQCGIKFNSDILNLEDSATINIPQIKFIPFFLFKSLIKIALSIMPINEQDGNEFTELKSWLLINDNFPTTNDSPFNYVYFMTLPFADRKPLVQLFKKKHDQKKCNIPTYSLLFSYGNFMYQIFLPNCKSDTWIEYSIKIPVMPYFVGITEERKRGFNLINGNVNERVTSDGYKTFVF